jgi:hypothetical protein
MSCHVLLEYKTKILDSCQLCAPRIHNSVGDIMCLSNYYVALELLTAIYDCELICRKLIFISYIICHKLAVYYFFKFWSPEPHGMFSRLHRRAHLKQWEQDKACLSKTERRWAGRLCLYIVLQTVRCTPMTFIADQVWLLHFNNLYMSHTDPKLSDF